MTPRHTEHWRACWWLLVATLCWGLSFPLIKTIWLAQTHLVPEAGSVFLASLAAALRFGIAGLLIMLFSWRTLRTLTRAELAQGAGLAFFSGFGILLQMDGLAYTSASTSAFLTQFYCLLIPVWAAWRKRLAPRLAVILSSLMVLAGVGILSGMNWTQLTIGRGEAETILASILFAGQILWLERPCYANNRVTHFTVVMFAGTTLLLAPITLATMPSAAALLRVYQSGPVWIMFSALILLCTLGAYLLMNRWQPLVTATEAGLIYCAEPVATSLFALFLPAWLSQLAAVNYANEHLTWQLVIGGALITAANLLIQLEAMRRKP